MTRRILIIHNPTAGKRGTALLDCVVAALCARGLAPEVVTTEWPEHATDLALSADADLVVAAGGDGTINEVVHGLMTRDVVRPAFATLPLGTTLFTGQIKGPWNRPMDHLMNSMWLQPCCSRGRSKAHGFCC